MVKITERGISAPWVASEWRLRQFHSPILHLEISSGCESAGFQLGGALGLQNSCGFQRILEPSSIATLYLQALLEKHTIHTW